MEEKKKQQSSHRKRRAAVAAAVMATAFLMTGTFAWKAISQHANNEIEGESNPGGRLHDDFDGKNKDVYVENYTDPDKGMNIYARVKLLEYMEVGKNPGNPDKGGYQVTVLGKPDAQLKDPTTWVAHIPAQMAGDHADQALHQYWSLKLGNADDTGEKWYLPTFNQDNSSLDADINGTLAGTDGDKSTGKAYDDYKEYQQGQSETKTLRLKGKTQDSVTHETKQLSYKSKVITMDEWKAGGKKPAATWVYDTDGWAYWAQPIKPGETTGLLLNGVEMTSIPDDDYYYAINATGQFATAGDWTGFDGDITADGKDLLNIIADRLPRVTYLTPTKGYQQFVAAGKTLELTVDVAVENSNGASKEKAVEWNSDSEEAKAVLEGNQFTPTEDMVGKVYKLTATSKFTESVTTFVNVTVLPADIESTDTSKGEDGSKYLNYGNNVYRRLESDGSLSGFICAGKDLKIGTGDDKTKVYDMVEGTGAVDATYGRFYLNLGNGKYAAMGPDKNLGTADDITLTSATNNWPEQITDTMADSVKVQTKEGVSTDVTVKMGQSQSFTAQVMKGGKAITNQKVTWSISGQKSKQTSISRTGVLTLGDDEAEGGNITVKATSQEDPKHAVGTLMITVNALGYEDLATVPAGSDKTVKIDGYYFYVMAKDGNEALLWAADNVNNHVEVGGMGNPLGEWPRTSIYRDVNNWYNGTKILRQHAVQKMIYYRAYPTTAYATTDSWKEITCYAFLPTEPDICGAISVSGFNVGAKDYTYNGRPLPVSSIMKNGNEKSTWLRDGYVPYGATAVPYKYTSWRYLENGSIRSSATNASTYKGIRPLVWVQME